jgi:hypothetical protein
MMRVEGHWKIQELLIGILIGIVVGGSFVAGWTRAKNQQVIDHNMCKKNHRLKVMSGPDGIIAECLEKK